MNTRHLGRRWLCIAALAFGSLASAGTPEEVVRAYMTAYQEGGAKVIAEFVHPAELARFKEMLMPRFREAAKKEGEGGFEMLFGKGATLAKVEAMSPGEILSGFMTIAGEQLKDVKFTSVEVLGAVPEKDLMHVVTRISAEGPKATHIMKMKVVTTRRHDDGWKLTLPSELESIGDALKAQ